MRQESLETYLANLAAHTSTPGGGAAAALTAAQGAALLAMVGHFSKKDTKTPWPTFILAMDKARRSFLNLAEDDKQAFQKVMDCFRLPHSDADRGSKMEDALHKAAEPPLNVMQNAWQILQTLPPYIEAANSHVVSDAGIAVSLLKASIDASIFNVLINRKLMKIEQNKAALTTRLTAIQSVYQTLCDDLYQQAMLKI